MTAENLGNLLGMGRSAELAGNNDEAISYYNRVLEADPSVPEAWLGKGRAAGWKSTLANLRIGETIVAFRNAIGSAPDDEKPAIAKQAASDIVLLGRALWGMVWKHFQQFSSVDGQWGDMVIASAAILDALDDGREWNPDYLPSLLLTIEICKRVLDQGVPADYAERLKAKRDYAASRIAAVDPSYEPPALATTTVAQQIEAKKESDAIGYVVAFVMMIVLGIVTAMAR